jgi:hypothetical protein
MNKALFGIGVGILAGIIDVLPMIIQKLSWDANLSAFCMWVGVGFLVATSNLKINRVLKGVLIAYVAMAPIGVLVAWKEPVSLIPICIMTLLLGAGVGGIAGKD